MNWGGYASLEDHAKRFCFTCRIENGFPVLIPGPGMEFLYIGKLGFETEVEAHHFLSGLAIGWRLGAEDIPYPAKKDAST